MKRKLLFGLALLVCGGGNLWAQTDVTSTYLTNADFSQGTPITVGTCTYAKDAAGNGTTYSQLVPVDGWDIPANGDARAGGLIAFGSGVWIGGPGYIAPATNSDGDVEGNILGLVGVWTGTAQYTQNVTFPAGTYTLVLGVYNSVGGTSAFTKNLIGFIEDGGTEHLATTTVYSVNTWKYEFITFTLNAETSGKISLGYQGSNVGSAAAQHLFLSGIQLFEGEVDAEAYEAAKTAAREAKEAKVLWDNAAAAASAALADEANANVTGSEKAALEAEVAKAEPTTTDAYRTAATALTDATTAFTSAKSTYDMVAAVSELEYADASKKPVVSSESTAAELIVALRAYYESHAMGEVYASALNLTSKLTNATNPTNTNGWTINNTSGNSGMRIQSGEPYTNSDGTTATGYFDSNSWNKAFTTKFTQNVELEAGKYIFTVKSRGNGINVYRVIAGEEYTDMPISASTGGVFGKGWNDYTVEFELDAKKSVALGVYMESGSSSNWLSFGDFRLVRLELYTEKATASDYEAMASALASAKAKALGFDVNEYAPYNNVEAITAIADAEAVNTEIDNPKADIDAITSALGNWTANEAEVNAFYDGTFSTREVQETSANGTKIPGWTSGNNIRQILKTEATFPGLADATAKTALFAWSGGAQYGEDAGYEMPLNANTIYKLSVKVAGWNNETRGDINVSVQNGEDGMAATVIGKADKDIKGNATNEAGMTSLEVFFVTGAAGNYVFSISSANNIVFSDVELKKAASQTLTLPSATKYAKGTYPTVTIDRTFSADKWNTLCVPFAFDKSSFAAVKVLSSVAEAGEEVSMTFADAEETVTAGTPCLVKNGSLTATNVALDPATTDGSTTVKTADEKTTVTYQGTYSGTTLTDANNNAWVVSNNDLYHVTSDVTVGAFRAYFTVATTSGEVKSLSFDFGGETAIQGVEADGMSRAAIFNLAGQRVKNAQKGIYIVNGKKVLVK